MLDPSEDTGLGELNDEIGFTQSIGSQCQDEDGKVYEEVMITVRDQGRMTDFFLRIMDLVVMFYPLLASIYSKVIWDCRTFTYPRVRNQQN